MDVQSKMGLIIQQARKEKKLSQTELANLVGYKDKTAIAKIESGKVDLPQSKIVAFSKALDLPIDKLFSDQSSNEHISSDNSDDTNHYYINDDAKELAQFLYDNPEYRVLFDATKNVKKEDIEFVKQMLDRFKGDEN